MTTREHAVTVDETAQIAASLRSRGWPGTASHAGVAGIVQIRSCYARRPDQDWTAVLYGGGGDWTLRLYQDVGADVALNLVGTVEMGGVVGDRPTDVALVAAWAEYAVRLLLTDMGIV